ncbi:MAG: ABC transporter permease [Sulfolobales archaeon]
MYSVSRVSSNIFYTLLSMLSMIILWQFMSMIINKSYLPSFTDVIEKLCENLLSGVLIKNSIISLTRILVAMLISLILGFSTGILIIWFRAGFVNNFIKMIVFVSYPIPHVALLPILFYFFDIEWSKIILILIISFYPITLSIIEWSSRFPRELSELIYIMGGNKLDLFKYVIFPSSLPGILTGVRISFNTAYAVIFIAESLVGSNGLGYLIYYYWQILDFKSMYSAIMMLSILGLSTYLVLVYLERKLLKWLY